MKFNKKGTAASEMWAPDTILFWIIFGIVLGFVAVVFVLIISKSSAEKAKIYFSPNCAARYPAKSGPITQAMLLKV